MEEKKFITEKEVSRITGLGLQTLRNQRSDKRGFPYVKLGKSVRYDKSDVLSIMDANKVNPNE